MPPKGMAIPMPVSVLGSHDLREPPLTCKIPEKYKKRVVQAALDMRCGLGPPHTLSSLGGNSPQVKQRRTQHSGQRVKLVSAKALLKSGTQILGQVLSRARETWVPQIETWAPRRCGPNYVWGPLRICLLVSTKTMRSLQYSTKTYVPFRTFRAQMPKL